MKKFFSVLLLILLVYEQAPLTTHAQGINLDVFKKRWKISFSVQDKMRSMSEEEREAFNQLSQAQRDRVIRELTDQAEKSLFEFHADNTFKVFVEGYANYEGTWRISEDGKAIIARTMEGIEEKVFIRKMTEEMIVVSSEARGRDRELVLVPKQRP